MLELCPLLPENVVSVALTLAPDVEPWLTLSRDEIGLAPWWLPNSMILGRALFGGVEIVDMRGEISSILLVPVGLVDRIPEITSLICIKSPSSGLPLITLVKGFMVLYPVLILYILQRQITNTNNQNMAHAISRNKTTFEDTVQGYL